MWGSRRRRWAARINKRRSKRRLPGPFKKREIGVYTYPPTYLSHSVARRRRRLRGSSTHTASRRRVSAPPTAPPPGAAAAVVVDRKEAEAEAEGPEVLVWVCPAGAGGGGCCPASCDSRTAMSR